MSYIAVEQSLELGDPVELYAFREGNNETFRASCAESVTYENNVYLGSSIKRNKFKQNREVFKNTTEIEMSLNDPFANQYISFPPSNIVTLTVFRGHFGDGEFITYWKGRIVGSNVGESTVKLQGEPIFTSLRKPGLRARFEYNCRHALYSQFYASCKVDQSAFAFNSTLSAVNSLNVTVPGLNAQPDGYYTAGMIFHNGIYRFITSHVGNDIVISQPLVNGQVGDNVIVYPGCDHTADTCKNKFNNIDNFGGFRWIPNKNPFRNYLA